MNMLVTGGAGFIGSHIANWLTVRGDKVRVLDDLSSGSTENVSVDNELIVGDAADEQAVRHAMQDVEVVFHLAAHRAVPRSAGGPNPD